MVSTTYIDHNEVTRLAPVAEPRTLPNQKRRTGDFALAFAMVASTFATTSYIAPQSKFPTEAPFVAPIGTSIQSTTEAFQFEDRDEVMSYIEQHKGLADLLKSLPRIIKDVFGDVAIKLSVFKDYEEDWDDLRVEIYAEGEVKKLVAMESELFSKIAKDKQILPALEHVTIACV